MRLLRTDETGEFSLTEDFARRSTSSLCDTLAQMASRYCTEEPTFEDLVHGRGKEKLGYKKLQFCGE